jgi:hypothetical protein
MSTSHFSARAAAHPVCQHFHAEQEIHMSTIAKNLIGGLVALLLCAGQGALVGADTSFAGLRHRVAVQAADRTLDRPTVSAYHRQPSGLAPQGDSKVAQR